MCSLFRLILVCLAIGSPELHAESDRFDVFASLIVWTARVGGADCWAEVITTEGAAPSNVLRSVDFGWDPGVRVGLGYGCGRWDTQAYYTGFSTCGTDGVTSGPGTVHSAFTGNFYIDNPQGEGISGPAYQAASIDWKIRFNIFDWDVGYHFFPCKSLTLRPYVGLKGGWIDQAIDTTWYNPALSGPSYYDYGSENLRNDFWGLGPQFGINTKWSWCAKKRHAFYLVGDWSGAIMWGHWSFGDLFENSIGQDVAIDFSSLDYGASMLRSFLGIGWELFSLQPRVSFSLELGYEAQFWLDQLQFYSFTAGRLANTLSLQGGTLALHLSY